MMFCWVSSIKMDLCAIHLFKFETCHFGTQISIIPKPALRGFWGSSLIKPPFAQHFGTQISLLQQCKVVRSSCRSSELRHGVFSGVSGPTFDAILPGRIGRNIAGQMVHNISPTNHTISLKLTAKAHENPPSFLVNTIKMLDFPWLC